MKNREFINPILVGRTEGRAPLLYRLFGIDVSVLATGALLLAMGTVLVYAALHGTPRFESLWSKHLIAVVTGLGLGLIFVLLPATFVEELSPFLYAGSLVLLAMVLFLGRTIHGSRSWFIFGPIQFQPSELAKFAFILFFSFLAVRYRELDPLITWPRRLGLLAAGAIPMALILAQNDLSSAITFGFILLIYFWGLDLLAPGSMAALGIFGVISFVMLLSHIVAGLGTPEAGKIASKLIYFGFGPGATLAKWCGWSALFIVASAILYKFLKGIFLLSPSTTWPWAAFVSVVLIGASGSGWVGWKALKAYQRNRMVSFLFPKADPFGSGYNITQSKIAIGSGGFMGKGLLLGSQTSLGFLPERHTDFAFAALCEEGGLVGALMALALLGILFWRLSYFVELARAEWGRLVALGLLGLWLGEVSINIAYVLGMFPILGIGLPFISYGGSRLVMNCVEIGLLLSISRGFYVYR
ncbi:MAG: FtsW/RodA/SpoVE family cell cycle protein [Elusimicrobiota bacterium]